MLKANELRIGNYVLAPKSDEFDLRVCKVFEIRNKHFKLIELATNLMFDQNRVEPIPLTEKWLEDFGFYCDSDKMWLRIIFTGELAFNLKTMKWCYEWGEWFPYKIEYVHQLQNLIFALTGTDLTTNTRKL